MRRRRKKKAAFRDIDRARRRRNHKFRRSGGYEFKKDRRRRRFQIVPAVFFVKQIPMGFLIFSSERAISAESATPNLFSGAMATLVFYSVGKRSDAFRSMNADNVDDHAA